MIEQFGGTLNFIAVLIPCLMGLFYGYRCVFAIDAFIEQYGLGAASEFMIKATGCCVGAQGIACAILIPRHLSEHGLLCIWQHPRSTFPHFWLDDREWRVG